MVIYVYFSLYQPLSPFFVACALRCDYYDFATMPSVANDGAAPKVLPSKNGIIKGQWNNPLSFRLFIKFILAEDFTLVILSQFLVGFTPNAQAFLQAFCILLHGV